jgi:hypothetical protein
MSSKKKIETDNDLKSIDKKNIKVNKKDKDDFVQMGMSLLNTINFKIAFFLFLIGMIIFSDMFINGVINKFSNTLHGECTTTKGTIIQLIFLVLSYIIIDLLNKSEII